jgi:hypothetical protein
MRVLVEGDEILMALLFKLFAEHPSCFHKLEVLKGGGHKAAPRAVKPLLRDQVMQQFAEASMRRVAAGDIVMQVLADGEEKTLAQLRDACVEQGHIINSASVALDMLMKKGRVVRTGPGFYRLNGAQALLEHKPKPARKIPAKRKQQHPLPEGHPRGVDMILDMLRKAGAPLHRREMMPSFLTAGFAKNSLDARIHAAMQDGLIERTGEGMYQLKQGGEA